MAELEFYDSEQNKISYTTTTTDAVTNTGATYWNHPDWWNRTNLSDGVKSFNTVTTGNYYMCGGGWLIPTANVEEIRYYASLYLNRIPEVL